MLRNTARCIGTMIGFVALFLIVVYGLFVLLQAMFSDVDKIVLQLSSSFVADVIISVCAFIYLRKRPLESVIFDRSKLLLLVPLLFVLWIFVQVTTKNFSVLFPRLLLRLLVRNFYSEALFTVNVVNVCLCHGRMLFRHLCSVCCMAILHSSF